METAKHGGDVYRNRITCDFSVSLNPLGMPEAVREALKSSVDSWERYPGMFLIRAFTKTYAMAGLRLGYAICGNSTLTEKLRRIRQPWSVSIPAQTAGAAALKESGYLDEARARIRRERNYLMAGLSRLGFMLG